MCGNKLYIPGIRKDKDYCIYRQTNVVYHKESEEIIKIIIVFGNDGACAVLGSNNSFFFRLDIVDFKKVKI